MSQTSDLAEKAKAHAEELSTQARVAATDTAVSQADKAKDIAAANVQQVADAAEAAAGELDPNSPQAQAVRQVADHIEGVATQLRTADVRALADQATQMARSNPVLFMAGAAVAGFAAARFLKARDPRPVHYSGHDDPWGSPTHYQPDPRHETVDTQTKVGQINRGIGYV